MVVSSCPKPTTSLIGTIAPERNCSAKNPWNELVQFLTAKYTQAAMSTVRRVSVLRSVSNLSASAVFEMTTGRQCIPKQWSMMLSVTSPGVTFSANAALIAIVRHLSSVPPYQEINQPIQKHMLVGTMGSETPWGLGPHGI